ncbi:hypothetical protein [Leptospira fluminis]|uniref:hypothetical protein n=1 Tax=Leptospira fluminis TaxID=2484979 RepID=UPI00143B23DC|nr:hypothetical protein [Leptospira fluminis]
MQPGPVAASTGTDTTFQSFKNKKETSETSPLAHIENIIKLDLPAISASEPNFRLSEISLQTIRNHYTHLRSIKKTFEKSVLSPTLYSNFFFPLSTIRLLN